MKKDIYHYYFDYDKNIIEVVKEKYDETDDGVYPLGAMKYGAGNFINVYTKCEHGHSKVYPKSAIGTVIGGKFVLLLERDDEKARQIFLDYLDQDIKKQYERLSRFIAKYDRFSILEIMEGIYE